MTLSDDIVLSIIALTLTATLSAAVGWLAAYFRAQHKLVALREENATLATKLDVERRAAEEKLVMLQHARHELANTFSALSAQALKHNTNEFLKLAQENLNQFQLRAQNDLGNKHKAIEDLLNPVKEALHKTEQHIHSMEKERKEAYGSITQHLESMTQTQQLLQSETRNLVNALRRPEVRGQWGELTLKRLAELAGMVEYCDFYPQEQSKTDGAAIRPDMIIRLPAKRDIIVDAKTPLDAYLSAIEASDDASRTHYLKKHGQNLRARVRELANKSYWDQFKHSPDFVVLFIPGDQFLSSALDHDKSLLEDALSKKIILTTPTSFVALLRAIAYGWQQEQLTENAEKIRLVGTDLYKRLATFTGHFAKLGTQLNSTLENYNRAVGSFERQVIPGAKRFTEMGVSTKKSLEPLEQIDTPARILVENQDTPH